MTSLLPTAQDTQRSIEDAYQQLNEREANIIAREERVIQKEQVLNARKALLNQREPVKVGGLALAIVSLALLAILVGLTMYRPVSSIPQAIGLVQYAAYAVVGVNIAYLLLALIMNILNGSQLSKWQTQTQTQAQARTLIQARDQAKALRHAVIQAIPLAQTLDQAQKLTQTLDQALEQVRVQVLDQELAVQQPPAQQVARITNVQVSPNSVNQGQPLTVKLDVTANINADAHVGILLYTQDRRELSRFWVGESMDATTKLQKDSPVPCEAKLQLPRAFELGKMGVTVGIWNTTWDDVNWFNDAASVTVNPAP